MLVQPSLPLTPRQVPADGDAVGHGIIAQLSLQLRQVADEQHGVVQRLLDLSGLRIPCQLSDPRLVVFLGLVLIRV